jgi:hypothetical protein
MRAKKNAWHCDPSTCKPRSIWSRQWCHSILSCFFDSLKSGYGPISENEIDSKSFNSQVIEALVCLNLLAGNLICWSPLKSKQPIDRSLCRVDCSRYCRIFFFSRDWRTGRCEDNLLALSWLYLAETYRAMPWTWRLSYQAEPRIECRAHDPRRRCVCRPLSTKYRSLPTFGMTKHFKKESETRYTESLMAHSFGWR